MKLKTRSIRRALGLLTMLATLTALTVPLGVPSAQANHGTRLMEAYPEKVSVGVGTTSMATITAQLTSAPTAGTGPVDVDFEIESGPGDFAGPGNALGNTPFSPDLTCSVAPTETECTVTYGPNSTTGRDVIRVWIDHDKNNATFEADATEGRVSDPTVDCHAPATLPDPPSEPNSCTPNNNPAPEPGDDPFEPDVTDVVERNWTAGAAAVLDCEPETVVLPSIDDPNTTGNQTSQTYTCTLTDEFGNARSGIRVDAENLNGANDPDNSASAGNNDYANTSGDFCSASGSSCSASISASEGESGTANICFWFDSDADALFDPAGGVDDPDGGDCDTETQGQNDVDLTDTVTATWQTRSTVGGGVDAEPETDVNNTGQNHVVTATVYDQFGVPLVGANTVKFEFFMGSPTNADGNTPASPDLMCTTNNSSSCTVSYTSNTGGRDRLCAWVNSDPTMSGDNQNGTCDGGLGPEGLNDADDDPANPDAPMPKDDDVDVIEKVWQVAGQASRLDCVPESDTNPSGTTHEITCTATDANGVEIAGSHIDAEATGTNDPDGNSDNTNPDFTCVTADDDITTPLEDETGTCTLVHGPNGGVGTTNSTGLTTYRAWIDIDNNNGTVEADTSEGRDEATTAGSTVEPDNTDVVEKSWVAAPGSVTISPKTDVASVGQCNPFTVTALNSSNQPAQGAVIDVEQVHALAKNATANDEPKVSFCLPTSGPNPSDVDTTAGDLGPSSASTPKEDPDNVGTAGGETVKSTDSSGQVTFGIMVEPMNNSDGSGQVDLTVWFEATPDDDDPNTPQDTAAKIWEKAEGRTIDCEPETATNSTGTDHVVTCTVEDRFGDPIEGEDVTFTEEGPGSFVGANTDSSDENGEVEATVTSNEAGTQTITGTLTDDLQGNEPSEVDECDRAANDPSGAPAGVCSDSVTKTWEGEPEPAECEDGVDNDGDGQIDFPNDPGCSSPSDDDESDPKCPGLESDPRNHVVGTPGNDTLAGTSGDDVICGLGGDDTIDGGDGDDLILGGDGDDDLSGGAGNDEIRGEGGKDTIRGNGGADDLLGGGQNDIIVGNAGEDLLVGNAGEDVLRGGKHADTIRGGSDDDTLQGGSGKDLLKGGKGKDTLRGKQGDDALRGGGGDDVLRGGSGNDDLNGGKGTDVCAGGSGNNTKKNCEG